MRVCLLVLISAFGPYVVPSFGLRLDHIVVYSLFIVALAAMLIGREAVMKRPMWAILALWAGAVIFMIATTLLFGEAADSRAVVAALETQMQPIALLLVLAVTLRPLSAEDSRRLVGIVATIVVILMCANAILAVSSVYVDTTGVISHFITTDAMGSSVSSRAASMGRYSGVFNQPLEAGIAYSVAVFAWTYLTISGSAGGPGLRFAIVLLVAGGMLTVSKLFVLGGLPVALVYGLWEAGKGHPSRASHLLFWGGASVSAMTSLGGWAGWDYLARLFIVQPGGTSDLVGLLTAGRFGQAGESVQGLFERTMHEAPLHGFGLGSFTPLDSGYIEFLYQGGALTLVLYVGVLIVLLVNALRSASAGIAEGRLQLLLWVLIVGGNFGAPVLTVNRASTILWVLLVTLMHSSWGVEREDRIRSSNSDECPAAAAEPIGLSRVQEAIGGPCVLPRNGA